MQSAATLPCNSNGGIKRTASNSVAESTTNTNTANSEHVLSNQSNSIDQDRTTSPPPEKRSFIVVESPIKLDTISSAEDLDIKVLRIQNKNLSERLVQRQKLEAELRDRIAQLQNKKAADDSKTILIDRYWTQLDEDLRLVLERFDNDSSSSSLSSMNNDQTNSNLGEQGASKSDSKSGKQTHSTLRNFLAKLNDWDRVELEDNLKERVKFTNQTVAKLMTNYDRLTKKFENYYNEMTQSKPVTSFEEKLKSLYEENCKLNDLVTKCQQKLHTAGLENKELEDKIAILDKDINELNSRNDELEYELDRFKDKAFKLDKQLADTLIKLNSLQKSVNANHVNSHVDQNGRVVLHNQSSSSQNVKSAESKQATSLTDKQLSEMEAELEQQRDLASSRLLELEKLNKDYHASLRHIESLKNEMKLMPENLIEQTSEYKALQTKYSFIINDNIKLKQALDETRGLLEMSRSSFQRQLEQMESDDLAQQKRLGNEMVQLEEKLMEIRKENELLRIEYEQNLAANEQTGPINKEMRSLITTLQTNNKLLKSDNVRTKKRLEEAQQEIDKLKKQLSHFTQSADKAKSREENQTPKVTSTADGSSSSSSFSSSSSIENKTENVVTENNHQPKTKQEDQHKDEQIKELKEEIKRLNESKRDMKNLLDIYTKSSKTSSSATAASSNDENSTKAKSVELDECKQEIKRLKDSLEKAKASKTILSTSSSPSIHNSNNHHHAHHQGTSDDQSTDQTKKIRSLEENIRELHKNLSNKKQEEAALLNDMEITGQAFEDMQEQNVRLMQQLKEKDDANFKLISERIKLENVQKILREEKDIYAQQVSTLQEQHENQLLVSKKLEEQLQVLTQNVTLLERELVHTHAACEAYKRQAVENVQMLHDLKLNAQKYMCQLKEAQQQIDEKSELLAAQSFSSKRAQEEIKHLQAKLERQKKFEMATSLDEVLREEIKEYKEQLRCPSCKVKQKDAVLTKCFHVFCYDCLHKRYETRQRKCPKCNANFGANDYRKLYLS